MFLFLNAPLLTSQTILLLRPPSCSGGEIVKEKCLAVLLDLHIFILGDGAPRAESDAAVKVLPLAAGGIHVEFDRGGQHPVGPVRGEHLDGMVGGSAVRTGPVVDDHVRVPGPVVHVDECRGVRSHPDLVGISFHPDHEGRFPEGCPQVSLSGTAGRHRELPDVDAHRIGTVIAVILRRLLIEECRRLIVVLVDHFEAHSRI